jgi:hypothetical protein
MLLELELYTLVQGIGGCLMCVMNLCPLDKDVESQHVQSNAIEAYHISALRRAIPRCDDDL